jgi:hypothetical protein
MGMARRRDISIMSVALVATCCARAPCLCQHGADTNKVNAMLTKVEGWRAELNADRTPVYPAGTAFRVQHYTPKDGHGQGKVVGAEKSNKEDRKSNP